MRVCKEGSAEGNAEGSAEDICRKLVRYARSCIIGNEPQALALFLAGVTGFAPHVKEYAPVLVQGEPSSGKTHLVRTIFGDEVEEGIECEFAGLFPPESRWHFTTASDKAPIYSPELREVDNEIKLVIAAEYKKLPLPIVEYFKSMSGDDPIFKYMVTNYASKDVDYILQKKRWFCVTYAQKEIDSELESRMLGMSVDENKWITQAVIEMNHGAKSVYYPITKLTYRNDTDNCIAAEIRGQVGLLAIDPVEVINPFPAALKDFEDNSRASSKRVSRMTEALFKASARVNHANREHQDGAVVMSQQDIVNVLAFSEIVQSMIMGVDRIDLAIIRFLGTVRHPVKEEEIVARIDESGLAELKLNEIKDRLKNLQNNNYLLSYPDESEKCIKFRYNPRKHMHRLIVHWDEIVKVDGLVPVIDPITDAFFENIIEYGKYFDKINSVGLEFQEVSSLEEENTLENRVRVNVMKLLSGAVKYRDVNDLVTDCRVRMGMTSLSSFGADNDIGAIVGVMVEENAIAMNEKLGYLVLLDESVRHRN